MAGNNNALTSIDDFVRFLASGITPFHAVAGVRETLNTRGYDWRSGDQRWTAAGEPFALALGDGALVAVRSGKGTLADEGAIILAAHTDSPTLRLKDRGITWDKGFLRIPTEIYGGPIVSGWLDRDLGVAGRVVTRSGETVLVDLPLRVVIPNVAIHLNKKVNEGFAYNKHDHLMAIAGVRSAEPAAGGEQIPAGGGAPEFDQLVAGTAGLAPEDMWECDLALYDPVAGVQCGADGELLVAPRIDDLVGVYSCLHAFLAAETGRTVILVLNNHEEIGSLSGEGAQSDALARIIDRLVALQGGSAEDAAVARGKSLIVSNDVAHALHPGFTEKYDSAYAPMPNGGPVLKQSATLRYATTASTGIRFRDACEAAGVSMQRLAMRGDMRAGTTVGPVSWARTGIETVDVGVGIIGMHGIRETMGVEDLDLMTRALKALAES